MTNEEKAYEISQSPQIEDGIWHYATAEISAIMMAEWKDQQFKEQKAEMVDKACEYFADWMRRHNDYAQFAVDGLRKAMEE